MERIQTAKKLTDCRWLNLYDIAYLDKGERERHWQIASRAPEPKCVTGRFSRPDAVIIVAFHRARQALVVTREYRVALSGSEYGFPAGLVDPEESPQEAACRELAEETGLAATRIVSVGPALYSSAGMTDESICMVWLECDGVPDTAGNEDSERIEVLFVPPRQASELCRDPALKFDAKAWLVLAAFGQTGNPWPFLASPAPLQDAL